MLTIADLSPGASFKEYFGFFTENPGVTYLDSAASSLTPKKVTDSMTNYYNAYGVNIHRGVYKASLEATDGYERSRNRVRSFLNASNADHIVFTRGATEGFNLLSYSLSKVNKELYDLKESWRTPPGPGDFILISESEHHANIIPWQLFCKQTGASLLYLKVTSDSGELDWSSLSENELERVKIISLSLASNVSGVKHDLTKAKELAEQVGAIFILDAAQAVCHGPLDVSDLNADFLLFSGHKMFGPNGIGILYAKEGLLERMPPFHGGGDMILSVGHYETTYNHPPHKFEAGTPPIAEVFGLETAIDILESFNWSAVEEFEQNLLNYGIEKFSELEGVRLFGPKNKRNPIFSFTMDDVHPHDIGSMLDEENIAIRTGHHCCQLLMKSWKVPATARASLYLYNTKEDIDKLIFGIQKVLKIFRR
jgi:cysteine desulfurase / selenocysteine lyase